MAEQFAVAAVPELYEGAKWSIKWLYRKYDYWKNPENYHAIMMEEATVLYKRRKDVAAEANRDPRMQLSEACRDWIRMVDEIREEVEKLETNYGKLNLPGTVSCFTLSKSMEQMAKELHDLWVKGEIFETRTAVERPPERVRHIHAPKTVDKPSLHRFVENIIDCLNDGKVKRIGLLGKAGIGKTTIMQNLNNHEKIAKMFHYVIWVTVPKDPSIEMLQQVIAQRLKLNLEGITGSDEIAHMISEKLKGSRYLLLLDEFRKFPNGEFLNLNALGINDNQMKSKVVFATRDRDNYFGMEINVQIKVEELSCADAWKMFQEIVGPIINRPGIKPIARKVLKECARIPLLIDRVARTFREMDDYHLWSEGLDRLRTKPKKFEGMEEVFEFLSICYNRLEEDRKICFLYSALYPEDYQIYKYYLLECWRAEGFTHGDQGHSVLDDLIKVSLLERSEKMKHIRMNKVLRDMALRISLQRKDSKFLVRDVHEKSEQPPDEKEWVQANRISLVDDKLRRLPEAPGCNNLLTLLLQKNSDLTVIPKQFFQYMQSLRVLDLHGIGITSLPSCLSSLRRLRALYLNSCKHLNVLPPTIQALEDLEVLDIRGTGIKKLPCEMVKLIALRCLRISSSSFGGDTLVNTVISRLLWLEELSIDVDSYEQWWDMIGKAVTEEVATLTKLTSLSFCFPKVDCLEIFIARNPSWKTNCLTEDNRFKFQFCVGYHDSPQYAILELF
ncbi:hypothetical protein L1049_014652 [Liquidambar formosana]|uniref:NB-ARC domain-containing protein n=1 Tax=Liquidambar formosana TaxID=63359 RepID=A0AAP0S334_LIQFO